MHNMAHTNNESANYPSCFICGCKRTGTHPLYIRQSGQPGPYFPFLETHEPPDGAELPTKCGKVLSCYACFAFLIQQWESYEKNKIPLVKRIYWLKRVDNGPYTGVEMGMQSEYASQVFGLNSDSQNPIEMKVSNANFIETESSHQNIMTSASPSLSADGCFKDCITSNNSQGSIDKKPDIQEEALDLTMERPKRKRKLPVLSSDETEVKPVVEAININTGALDLSMPDKNALTEVCYFCGNQFQKGTLSDIYARNFDRHSPFFPSLVMHPRPSGSKPIEVSGRVSGCKDCLGYLGAQFNAFENLKIPYKLRKYKFLKSPSNSGTENYLYMCYKCGNMVDSSMLQLIYIKPNSEGKSYHPLLQLLPLKPGALPVTPQGQVHVCIDCKGTMENENLNFKRSISGDCNSELENNSPQKMKIISESNSSNKLLGVSTYDSEVGLDSVSCCLCHQNFSLNQMQTLSMVPDPSNSKEMFFPFLKFLPQVNQNMITEDGRILACKACYSHLSSQWLEYEKDDVPADQRYFSLRALSISSQSPRLTPHLPSGQSTPSEASTSTPPINSPLVVPHLHNLQSSSEELRNSKCKPIEGYHGQSLKELEVVAVTTKENSLTLAAMTTQRALNININCYICGFYSKAGQTYSVKSKVNGKEMFFPFLNRHVSAHIEATVDDSTYLVCMICFHSLVVQWQHYEKGRIEYYARFYDTYNFSCFICGTKTYRKRLYLLTVRDYPFLKEHNCPPGGMVVNNGHSVVVCKDCYMSLNEQYTALERLGVPVEKRQYNWIQRPPPPEFNETLPGTMKPKASCFGQKGISSGQHSVPSVVMPCTGGIGSCHKDIPNSYLQKSNRETNLLQQNTDPGSNSIANQEACRNNNISSSKNISQQKSCNAEERTRTSASGDKILPQTTSVQVD